MSVSDNHGCQGGTPWQNDGMLTNGIEGRLPLPPTKAHQPLLVQERRETTQTARTRYAVPTSEQGNFRSEVRLLNVTNPEVESLGQSFGRQNGEPFTIGRFLSGTGKKERRPPSLLL